MGGGGGANPNDQPDHKISVFFLTTFLKILCVIIKDCLGAFSVSGQEQAFSKIKNVTQSDHDHLFIKILYTVYCVELFSKGHLSTA